MDLLKRHSVDVDVLIWRAGTVVLSERIEEGRIHNLISRNHTDVESGRTKEFPGLNI